MQQAHARKSMSPVAVKRNNASVSKGADGNNEEENDDGEEAQKTPADRFTNDDKDEDEDDKTQLVKDKQSEAEFRLLFLSSEMTRRKALTVAEVRK